MAWWDNLEAGDRNAASALVGMFEQYGLGSLGPKIVEYLKQGYNSDTIYVMLQQTKEWKQRFKANDARLKAGLSVLDPNEYLQTERAYRQAIQAAGLPKGFYDSTDDFTNFLIKDVSPQEIAERAMKARTLADTVDNEQKKALARMGISTGDLASYYLDPKKALPTLEKNVELAKLNAERNRAGLGYDDAYAQELFGMGVTSEQAREGYNVIATQLPTYERLGEISGIEFGVEDIQSEVFGGNAEATRTRNKLASQERARGRGAAGTGSGTLTRDRRFN
ncbi:hypothetical protein [Jiangella anatolica]|uniref:Uncharacterized protein n=1 Tax=Jiangella anatolica TaxID=2670374 RepID=A0A2W2BDV5_9ACTN|nr:hypothetical protein [Jiangella anatolica]PZF84162.1 hypothetical protein C1I92_09945 [Jiangella anatolica]